MANPLQHHKSHFEGLYNDSKTLEEQVEDSLKQRMQKFIPPDIDLVDYDKEQLQKTLDLEIM